MTEIVIVEDTDETPAGPQEAGAVAAQFYLYDEMFEVAEAKRTTKNDDGQKVATSWEWVWPNYTVSEVAKFFFALGPHWLRWRYHPSRSDRFPEGYFVLDGEKLEEKRTPHGTRYYTLPDIERMAHALAANGVLDGEKLVLIVELLRKEALLYGVDSYPAPPSVEDELLAEQAEVQVDEVQEVTE